MELKKLISNFVAQICEKNYASSGKVLDQIVTEKFKKRITEAKEKIEHKDSKCDCEKKNDKCGCEKSKGKKLSPAQKKIAKAANPKNKITGADFKALKKGSKKVTKKG